MRSTGFGKLSRGDVVLLVLGSLIGGAGAARVILSLANQYLSEKLDAGFRRDISHEIAMETLRVVLSRLKKGKLIEQTKSKTWQLTRQGKEYSAQLVRNRVYAAWRGKHGGKKSDTLIVFDVPELDRKKRDYLRLELVALGYTQLQRSVWMGLSPLPREFIEYLHDLRVLPYVHILSVKESGTLPVLHA